MTKPKEAEATPMLLTEEEQGIFKAWLEKQIEAATAPPADPMAGLKRGRVVMYHPHIHEARNADAGPWTALVTHVGGVLPGHVTLAIFPPIPLSIGVDPVARRTEVPHAVDESRPEPGSWSWPKRD